jgi:hypothetical protein
MSLYDWEKNLTFVLSYKMEKHLNQEQRYTVFVLPKQGCSKNFITCTIDKDRLIIIQKTK